MSLRLHPDVASTDTDDGIVLLNQRTGRFWQLNASGTYVLSRLLEGRQTEQVAAELAVRHGVDEDRAHRDVAAVIEQLRAARLVVTQ